MKTTLCILSVFLFLFSSQQASSAPVQWSIANGGNGHYYEKVIQATSGWHEARAAAELLEFNGIQGHLVTITSAAEQNFLKVEFPQPESGGTFWLGGFQDINAPGFSEPSGGWRWVTDEPFIYTHWEVGEPNQSGGNPEEFLDTYVNSWGWNDIPSSQIRPGFYVEYPVPIPEPSSFVLLILGALLFSSRQRARH